MQGDEPSPCICIPCRQKVIHIGSPSINRITLLRNGDCNSLLLDILLLFIVSVSLTNIQKIFKNLRRRASAHVTLHVRASYMALKVDLCQSCVHLDGQNLFM